MRLCLLTLPLLLILSRCSRELIGQSVQPGIIEGQTFRTTLLIDGHDYDGTILRNCRFENISGDGLQIRDVDNLRIEDCEFTTITGDAIRFRNSGSSDGTRITYNVIHDIGENGILAPEHHTNAVIRKNRIYDVATDPTASRFGKPHHGIYWQGPNVTIAENVIYHVRNNGGNDISIRTYGTIARNRLSRAADHA
ncbi:right-handed parallel beta-helix repeat-containing protein [Lewinella sp. IMCC34183]|uniref:right-handed parallel beta-helix repeat-containing protein n=1 Tax=Lewinella sp. IMCC34183 TaxID=2248762 RepID=UPI0013002B4E|nr:right-handed parallel beta-helix repeat-containing protein [Lewinella sp. IMCC34183]